MGNCREIACLGLTLLMAASVQGFFGFGDWFGPTAAPFGFGMATPPAPPGRPPGPPPGPPPNPMMMGQMMEKIGGPMQEMYSK